MKKTLCLFLAFCLLIFTLSACGAKPAETPAAPTEVPQEEKSDREWPQNGYYADEKENFLSITWMEDVVDPGWYVGVSLGEDLIEDSWGGTLAQEDNALRGTLDSSGSKADLVVSVAPEGENGVILTVEGGDTYHLTALDLPDATIFVTINTEGWGNIAYAEGENAPEIDPEYPYQSAVINLAEPAVHTFVAWPNEGTYFVKWTKNGEDLSTEEQITVNLDESADYVAVFAFEGMDDDGQNPVMNFVGEYACDRAHALVEALGAEDALITIEWGSSAWELARWVITGTLDTDTLTVAYSDAVKSVVTYDDNGEVTDEKVEYEDGTGTIVFGEDNSFTWHEDGADRDDPVFAWAFESEDPGYYSAVTAMDKGEVEEFCYTVRNAYLEEDWAVLAGHIRYPLTVNGRELKTEKEFLSYMQGKHIHESDRAAMEKEFCYNMFFNGQGICLGDGEIWILDPNYMTEKTPVLKIIAISGIVK